MLHCTAFRTLLLTQQNVIRFFTPIFCMVFHAPSHDAIVLLCVSAQKTRILFGGHSLTSSKIQNIKVGSIIPPLGLLFTGLLS